MGEAQEDDYERKNYTIYQCSLEDEFEDLQEVKQQAHTWQNLTVVQRQGPDPIIPSEWKDAVKYLRQTFHANRYYSVRPEVWNLISGSRGPAHATQEGDAARATEPEEQIA